MKDYCKIEENSYKTKRYFNENDQYHRLIGPAIEWYDGDECYYIHDIYYMGYYKNENELFIRTAILELNSEYEKYIKQNIKDLIIEYNPKINLFYLTKKEGINNLPNWIKDLIII